MDVYGAVFVARPEGPDGVPKLLAALAERRTRVAAPLRERVRLDRVVAPPDRSWALVARWGAEDERAPWVAAQPGEPAPLCDLLRDLSGPLRQVIVIHHHHAGGRVEFERWADGALARRLIWADGIWVRAQGAAEAWEAQAFPEAPPSVGARAPAASAAALRAAERAYGLWYAFDAEVGATDVHTVPAPQEPLAPPPVPSQAVAPRAEAE